MKKNNQKNRQSKNPYERIFDDANKLIKEMGYMSFLDSIPDDECEDEKSVIPFPYGNHTIRPYNFN